MATIAKVVAPATLVLLLGTCAYAASPVEKCEAAKVKISTKYSSCLLKAQLKTVKNPAAEISGDLAKCDTTFTDKWTKAETKGGGACPTSGDAGSTQSLVTSFTGFLVHRFKPVAFTDNGDGTITDNRTGLMWEKKDGADGVANYGDPDDVDNLYTWSNSDVMPDGTAFTELLGSLNNCYLNAAGPTIVGGLGGHCDWRLPTMAELTSIYDSHQPGCGGTAVPCTPPIFLPVGIDPTFHISSLRYWSCLTGGMATSAEAFGYDASSSASPKSQANFVRAVRGGP